MAFLIQEQNINDARIKIYCGTPSFLNPHAYSASGRHALMAKLKQMPCTPRRKHPAAL